MSSSPARRADRQPSAAAPSRSCRPAAAGHPALAKLIIPYAGAGVKLLTLSAIRLLFRPGILIPDKAREQRMHELLGVELLEVLHLLAEADELDGKVQLMADRDDDPALGRAVELRQHEAGHAALLAEHLGLAERVLPCIGVENEQHLMRSARNLALDDAEDLVQLFHQVALVLQPARRVAQKDVRLALLGRLDGVIHDRRRIGARLLADDVDADALAPHFKLLDRAGPEGVAGRHQHRFPLALELMGELADRRRFADAVDPDEQNDRDAFVRHAQLAAVVAAEQADQLLRQHRLQLRGILDLALLHLGSQVVDQFHDGVDADIRADEDFLQLLVEILVDLLPAGDELLHPFHESRAGFGQPVLEYRRDRLRLGGDAFSKLLEKSHAVSSGPSLFYSRGRQRWRRRPLLRQSGRYGRLLVLKPHRYELGDAALLHRDAVQHVRFLHRAFAVGDDDELGQLRELPQILGEARDIGLVERRLHLVEHAEGNGLDLEDGEQQGDRGQRPLAAGEQLQVLQLLARRLGDDVDAGLEHPFGIDEHQIGAPSSEQLGEYDDEVAADLLEGDPEALRHLLVHLPDDFIERRLGLDEIQPLRIQEFIAFPNPLVFFDGAKIDFAERGDAPLQVAHRRLHLGGFSRHGIAGFGQLIAEAVFLAQLAEKVVQLHIQPVDGDFRLPELLLDALQSAALLAGFAFAQLKLLALVRARRPLEIRLRGAFLLAQPQPVELLDLLHRLGFERFLLLKALAQRGLQGSRLRPRPAAVALDPVQHILHGKPLLIRLRDLDLEIGQLPLQLLLRRFARLAPLLRHRDRFLQARFAYAQLIEPAGGFRCRLVQLAQLLFVAAAVGTEDRALFGKRGGLARDMLQLRAPLLLLHVQPLRRLPMLVPILGGDRQFLAQVRLFPPKPIDLLLHVGGFHVELFDLPLAAEQACAFLLETAPGHGAAGIDDVAFQRHDAEAVAAAGCDPVGAFQILGQKHVAEQIVHDILVPRLAADQLGGNADVAFHRCGLALVLLRNRSPLDDIQGKERRPSQLTLLQESDRRARRPFVLHDDMLQRSAQCRLDGGLDPLRHPDELGDGAVHALESSGRAPRSLEHLADAVHEAVERILHFLHRIPARGERLQPLLPFAQGGAGFLLQTLNLLHPLGLLYVLVPNGLQLLHRPLERQLKLGPAALQPFRILLPFALFAAKAVHSALERFLLLLGIADFVAQLGHRAQHFQQFALERFARFGRNASGDSRQAAFFSLHSAAEIDEDSLQGACLGPDLLFLRGHLLLAAAQRFQRLLQLDAVAVEVAAALLEHLAVSFAFLVVLAVLQHSRMQLLQLRLQLAQLHAVLLQQRIMLADDRGQLQLLLAENFELGVVLVPALMHLIDLMDVQADLAALELFLERLELDRPLRLLPQRLDLILQLRDEVVDAQQVALGVVQLALGFPLAGFVLHDAGGFLENAAPVLRTRAEDFLDAALPDDGIGFLADARIHEQLRNILEPAGLAVDHIFAVAAPVHAPGHRHLLMLERQRAVGVVQRQRDLAVIDRLAGVASGEDDVFHLAAAEALGALLAEHPPDAVGNIALAAAVRPDDGGNAANKLHFGFVRKGFEAR
ncbi:hypothetical protein BN871_GX_00030 [Paenibacillus sp. P22]|nr:hypothetical protein BN871_GX_00030 [Paenibacillus sp. P22]